MERIVNDFTINIATANGTKTAIMLEECGLDYEIKLLDMAGGAHKSDEYLAMNPVGKMPVIVDRDGPGGKPVATRAAIKRAPSQGPRKSRRRTIVSSSESLGLHVIRFGKPCRPGFPVPAQKPCVFNVPGHAFA